MRSLFWESATFGVGYGWSPQSAPDRRRAAIWSLSLVRGRFGELLAPREPHGESDLFLLGLLSLIDVMLEMPMAEVLEKLPLDRETKSVLVRPAERAASRVPIHAGP